MTPTAGTHADPATASHVPTATPRRAPPTHTGHPGGTAHPGTDHPHDGHLPARRAAQPVAYRHTSSDRHFGVSGTLFVGFWATALHPWQRHLMIGLRKGRPACCRRRTPSACST